MLMTKQEIFTKAYLGLKGQGFAKAYSESRQGCQYRAPDGLRCAIGHVLPDELYVEMFDEKFLSGSELKQYVSIFDEVPDEFLDDLQGIHDNSYSAESMEHRLLQFADKHSLTVPE